MSYINVGAKITDEFGVTGDVKTKKQLKEALASTPDRVTFYGTSPMGPQQFARPATITSLPEGYTLTVSGPNPYTSRVWDASVKVVKGKIKVS
jgi:hypothetical protein